MPPTLKQQLLVNPADAAEPAWEIARLFPNQGVWSEQEYLQLNGNRLVEFSHGWIEVLAMPTEVHQLIVAYLYGVLAEFLKAGRNGVALFSPLRVRLWEGKFREPDVVFMLREHASRRHNDYWEGADLVMEVVSDDDRRRDLELKRFEYARAGIPEYWIVDPKYRHITVLKLVGQRYEEHGIFAEAQIATSLLLPRFAVDVTATFKTSD